MCVVDFDPPDFIAHTWRHARKPHRCCECDEPIVPGTRYEYTAGSWSGKLDTFRRCEWCVELAAAVFEADCSWCYESLLDDARATLDSWEHAAEHPEAVGRVAGVLRRIAERQLDRARAA